MALIQDNHVVKQVASANLAIGVANRTDSASWGNSVQSAFSFFFRPLLRNWRYFPQLALRFSDSLPARFAGFTSTSTTLIRHVDVTGLYFWLLFVVRPTKTFVARDRGCAGITARRRLCG